MNPKLLASRSHPIIIELLLLSFPLRCVSTASSSSFSSFDLCPLSHEGERPRKEEEEEEEGPLDQEHKRERRTVSRTLRSMNFLPLFCVFRLDSKFHSTASLFSGGRTLLLILFLLGFSSRLFCSPSSSPLPLGCCSPCRRRRRRRRRSRLVFSPGRIPCMVMRTNGAPDSAFDTLQVQPRISRQDTSIPIATQ